MNDTPVATSSASRNSKTFTAATEGGQRGAMLKCSRVSW